VTGSCEHGNEHKVQGISARAWQLQASQEGACSVKLVVVSFTDFS
jgi:hypothetical protein